MQTREKLLAGALAGVVGLWFGVPLLERTLVEPLNDLEIQETALVESVDLKSAKRLELARADNDLKNWRNISLPPDPQDAQRLYQEWLIDLAQMSGLAITKVSIDRRVPEGDTFSTVPITLEAKGTLQELTLFLDRFESINLLHRISRCDVTSSASEGNPKLSLVITAEGISILNAAERSRLFPETFGWGELERDSKELVVQEAEEFPKTPPFLVRIDDEIINVVSISEDKWELQRGVEKTFASAHGENPIIELFPVQKTNLIDDKLKKEMWSQSLFTKPAPLIDYKPELVSTTPPPIMQGRNWTWKMDVKGWNPDNGTPLFQLLEAPPGMSVEEKTGTLNWRVPLDEPLGILAVEAIVWGEGNRNAGFASTLNLRIREPNQPPILTPPENIRFFLGRESRIDLKATDPDNEQERLTYTLEGAPEGMTINSTTGAIQWKPSEEMEPQQMTVLVTVKDSDEFPEQAKKSIAFSIEEDSAKYAYLIACIDRQPQGKEAWIFDRATNQKTVLHLGENVSIADLKMQVEEIGKDYLVVKRLEDLYRLEFEQPLSQMSLLPRPPQPETVATDAAQGFPPAPALPEAID